MENEKWTSSKGKNKWLNVIRILLPKIEKCTCIPCHFETLISTKFGTVLWKKCKYMYEVRTGRGKLMFDEFSRRLVLCTQKRPTVWMHFGHFEKLVNIRIRDGRRQKSVEIGSYSIENWTQGNVVPLNNSDVQAPFILLAICMLNGGLVYCLTSFFLIAHYRQHIFVLIHLLLLVLL